MTEQAVYANHRYIDEYGRDVVLTTYAPGGVDDYGDATLVATASTIQAIRKMARGGFARDASGAIPTGDATFWVKDTVTFPDSDTIPASQITDDSVDYEVIQLDDQRAGIIAVLVEKKR